MAVAEHLYLYHSFPYYYYNLLLNHYSAASNAFGQQTGNPNISNFETVGTRSA